MNKKPFVIGHLALLFICQYAYADMQIDNQNSFVLPQDLIAAKTDAVNTPTQEIVGKSATGELQGATMDQNGHWHAETPPKSSNNLTNPNEPNR